MLMFNLNEIEFIGGKHGKRDVNRDLIHYSFVGIKRNLESEKLQFWLPLGFENFDNSDYDTVKKFFFRMYRTLKKFISKKEMQLNEGDKDNQRDGLIKEDHGFSFSKNNIDEAVYYTKLNALDSILDGYDELKISSLLQKEKSSEKIDYSKIHQRLYQAFFLEEDVAYVDEMVIPSNVIERTSPPILQLFCFIYTEIKVELEEYSTVPDLAKELSEAFKEKHLYLSSSLFDKDFFKETIGLLKDILEEINNKTAYKDEDYWYFFDAIESFLYGENDFTDTNGSYWGINSFSRVWEDMCQTYVLNYDKNLKDRILFADIDGNLQNYKNLMPNPFELTMVAANKKRYLRPDLVYYISEQARMKYSFEEVFHVKKFPNNFYEIELVEISLYQLYKLFWDNLLDIRAKSYYDKVYRDKVQYGKFDKVKTEIDLLLKEFENDNSQNISIKIIDYKYMSKVSFDSYRVEAIDFSGANKIAEDIKKQLIYEWSIQNNLPFIRRFPVSFESFITESEYWIPVYSEDQDFESSKKSFTISSDDFNQSRIKVIGINFNILQKMYIAE